MIMDLVYNLLMIFILLIDNDFYMLLEMRQN